MTWVILGAGGQLGQELARRRPHAVAWSRAEADFRTPEAWLAQIEALRPTVLLNAASDNVVDRAETDPQPTFLVNTWTVRRLAQMCARVGAVFVHYSSNLVFGPSPASPVPWNETDTPQPLSVYGVSKLAGECFVRAECPRHLVIRTAGVLGMRANASAPWNFVEKILDAARRGSPLRIADDQFIAPISTQDLATATLNLIQCGANGLFHVNGRDACSWYEYARVILERSGIVASLQPIATQALNLPARRPLYSVMSNRKYVELGFREPNGWSENLDIYLRAR